MKWKKLGQIFDPTTFNDGFSRDFMKTHSQCTSVIELDNCLRVFFSCRPLNDKDGQARSYTTFLDLDKENLFSILKVSKQPVLPLGDLGTFDEFAVYPTSVIRFQDKLRLYYAGWTRCKSVPFNTSIGFAISENNGISFKRLGKGPILSPSLNEPFVISGPKVRIFDNKWYMYYISGSKWIKTDQTQEIVYKIRLATSNDGLTWEKLNLNIIEDILDENECQAGPDVFYYKGKYHMYFVYREGLNFRSVKGRGYKIGYAYSSDLINWTREDSKSGIEYSQSGWDSSMHHYPHVFSLNNKLHMLYNGNDFGKYGFGLAILENE